MFRVAARRKIKLRWSDKVVMAGLVREPVGPGSLNLNFPNSATAEFGCHPDSKTPAMKQYFVYFVASRLGGALYVGVTSDLLRRVHEHKNGLIDGHTKRYGIDRLVYFEVFDSSYAAIQREKAIKHWPRVWKTRLIGKNNPTWRDLFDDIASPG